MVAPELTVYILTYQNQFQIYTNLIPLRYRNVTSFLLPPSFVLLLLYILNLYMLQTQEYIVLIIIYNCMSIKKAEKRKERKYPCIAFVIFNFLFTILVFFISSRWFDLPSGVISLLQYYDPTHLLCTVIAKYIIFLYVISQTQLHTCILFYIIALQIREKRRGNMHFYCNTLFVFLMCMQVFIWVYLLLS